MINVLSVPDYCTFVTDEKKIQALRANSTFSAGDIVLSVENGAVKLSAETTPVKTVFLRWNGDLPSGMKFLGDAFERGYGKLGWQGFCFNRLMPWYFLAADGEKNYGCGVKTNPDSCCYWLCDRNGITLVLDTRCGGEGVILGGNTINAAEIVFAESENEKTFAFAKKFCAMLCGNPLLPPSPVYGSNNWYYAYGNSSAAEILNDTDILVSLTDGLENRPYMVIDDCWQPLARTNGAAGRPIDRGNELFPDMQGLAAEMKSKGVKPGIWFRPMYTHERFLPSSLRCDREKCFLDLTEPDALALIAEDTDRIASWGYELIKYDYVTFDIYGTFGANDINFLHSKGGWRWHDHSVTNAMAIKNLYDVIRDNSRGAVLIGCNAVGHLATGKIHLHRSGDDTSGREWQTTLHKGVNTLAFRLPQNRNFFNVDADCVGVTEKVPWNMNRQFLDLVARSGSPLFCSIKPSALNDVMAEDIRAAFEINSVQNGTAEPLDWMDATTPYDWIFNGEERKTYRWAEEAGATSFIL